MVERYDAAFEPMHDRLRPVKRSSPVAAAWHLYPILCLGGAEERADLFHHLVAHGISPQVHYIPLSQQPFYRAKLDGAVTPGADAYYERVISLPLFVGLRDEEQQHVIDTVAQFFG